MYAYELQIPDPSPEEGVAYKDARLSELPPNWASFDWLGPENNALGG